MERTTVPVANLTDIKNKEYLTLRDITPQWFERLNKILNENDKGIIHRLYSEINDYKRCIVGEAYGYDSSYVVQGTKKNCQECIAISGNFSYVLRRCNKEKLEEIIYKFTKHWNEKHRRHVIV
jgi:uroporphyrinogen-III decarboxylase